MSPETGNNAAAGNSEPTGRRLRVMSLAALGVVYGDIGTSPLYAIRECFHGEFGIAVSHDNVLGVLSLMFWALVLIVSVKYLALVLRADNHGEGGVIALTALASQFAAKPKARSVIFVAIGLFAGSLLYGDGMITPAISVLSAVEGIGIITPTFDPFVLPLTITILIALFLVQSRGTERLGELFGPITGVWLVTIAVLGLRSLIETPPVLAAVSPAYGVRFLVQNGLHGFLVLGAVFLVATGTEALYADMGHFGRRPIRVVWYGLVAPSLLCSYFGQGALLLREPDASNHPFYALAPDWALVPLVLLATMATIIASQAVISGAFSLTRQAIQLGYLPRMRIVHTSEKTIGQIFVPQVNTLLMIATIGLVLGFQSSSKLAAAYGVAVTTTMTITTVLFFLVARTIWRWGWVKTLVPAVLFLVVDLSFFAANISKIAHGAWFPLAIGLLVFVFMTTWKRGRTLLYEKIYAPSPTLGEFVASLSTRPPIRIEGQAVFMSGSGDRAPPPLLHNLQHNQVLHAQTAILTVITEDVPRIKREDKVRLEDLGQGVFSVVARYGFMEDPSVPYVLALANEQGLDFDIATTSFFLGRERIIADRRPLMPVWREKIFAFMSQNALGATAFFHIPPAQVIELGSQVAI